MENLIAAFFKGCSIFEAENHALKQQHNLIIQ
jgi:hypothetical protein